MNQEESLTDAFLRGRRVGHEAGVKTDAAARDAVKWVWANGGEVTAKQVVAVAGTRVVKAVAGS